MAAVAKKLPGVKSPAVWLPHTVYGISNSGVIEDLTGGKFGPFAGQLFVADQGQSKITRVALEQVKGVWQGAAIASAIKLKMAIKCEFTSQAATRLTRNRRLSR